MDPNNFLEDIAPFCPNYTKAIEIIGKRWTGAIIRCMLAGATRFSEILGLIPSLSDRLLSERLKELEAEGIVSRRVLPSTPVRVEYRLTEKGMALASVVTAVGAWADRWVAMPESRPESAPAPGARAARRLRAEA